MNPADTETFFSDGGRGTGAFRWRPGWREAAVFLALAVLGLLVWFAGAPGVTAELFCFDPGPWNPNLPFVSLTQISLGVAALAGGFVSPRGFYLWGIALAAHSPFTHGLSAHALERDGVEFVGGTRGLVEFALITAVLIAFATFCYTALSAVGAGLRLLARGVVPR